MACGLHQRGPHSAASPEPPTSGPRLWAARGMRVHLASLCPPCLHLISAIVESVLSRGRGFCFLVLFFGFVSFSCIRATLFIAAHNRRVYVRSEEKSFESHELLSAGASDLSVLLTQWPSRPPELSVWVTQGCHSEAPDVQDSNSGDFVEQEGEGPVFVKPILLSLIPYGPRDCRRRWNWSVILYPKGETSIFSRPSSCFPLVCAHGRGSGYASGDGLTQALRPETRLRKPRHPGIKLFA